VNLSPVGGDGRPGKREPQCKLSRPKLHKQYLPDIPPPGLIFSSGKCALPDLSRTSPHFPDANIQQPMFSTRKRSRWLTFSYGKQLVCHWNESSACSSISALAHRRPSAELVWDADLGRAGSRARGKSLSSTRLPPGLFRKSINPYPPGYIRRSAGSGPRGGKRKRGRTHSRAGGS
jgi:hypothetical protein